MLQRNIKKQPKTCSVATRRKLFRGIMRVWNPFLKREWLNRFKIRDYKQAYRLIFEYLEAFTTRNEFTVIATLCHQMNSSEYIKEHTLRRSCGQVEFGRNFSF